MRKKQPFFKYSMGSSIDIIVIIIMKHLADIIKNYTPLTTLEKAGQIAKSAYLSATDYHEYFFLYTVAITTVH